MHGARAILLVNDVAAHPNDEDRLEKFGVTSFTSVGQPFDPERHEAIARVPAQEQPEGTVVDETARGYLLNGRILRPAMVTVASSPDSP